MISSQIPMRRYENQIHDPEMIGAMLDMFDTVYVGSIDEIYPYVVPLSFGYEMKEGKLYIYVHTAREGHKVDLWSQNPYVSVTFSKMYNHPDVKYKGGMHDFRSVMALGTITRIDRKESVKHGTAVQALLRHNKRGRNQFSVPHYMFMDMYMIVCEWKDVSGKSEEPLSGVAEIPFPDVYKIEPDNIPYDYNYFFSKKYYSYAPVETSECKLDMAIEKTDEALTGEDILLGTVEDLEKEDISVTVKWSGPCPDDEKEPFDCDLMAFLTDMDGKIPRRYDLVFYNQKEDRSRQVIHLGDDALGRQNEESIMIKAGQFPGYLAGAELLVSIYEAGSRKQNLGMIRGLQVIFTCGPEQRILYHWKPGKENEKNLSLLIGRICIKDRKWFFCPKNETYEEWRIPYLTPLFGLTKWKE